jgi:four helix bundle protein
MGISPSEEKSEARNSKYETNPNDQKDFIIRVKVCRKEAKESRYWLKLIDTDNVAELEKERVFLIAESTELMNIFGAIFQKSQ